MGEGTVHHARTARHAYHRRIHGKAAGRHRTEAAAGAGVHPFQHFDNPALLANDPGYLASLASMPEAEKQALLYGSWDSFSGQVFTEWRNDPAHYEDQR